MLNTAPVSISELGLVDQRDLLPAAHDADRAGDLIVLPPVPVVAPAINERALAAELVHSDPPYRLHGPRGICAGSVGVPFEGNWRQSYSFTSV